jgi:hypothetical protein
VTPTLAGRIQTRAFLLLVLGVPICYLEGLYLGDPRTAVRLLGYVLSLGVVWDALYTHLQTYRWDHDWPPWLQLVAGVAEGIALFALLTATTLWQVAGLTGPPGVARMPAVAFVIHYSSVWIAMFGATQGPLRVLFPWWRFSGGRIG